MRTFILFALAAGFAWFVYDRFFRSRSSVEQHLAEQDALARYGSAVNRLADAAKPVDYLDIFRQGLRGVTAVPGTMDAERYPGLLN